MDDNFSRRFEQEREMGRLVGLQITQNVHSQNHSQFIDNTLLQGGDSKIIARIFKGILDSYIVVPCAKVNTSKNQIYGWNFPYHILGAFSVLLDFPFVASWNSFKYLGLLISMKAILSKEWDDIIHNI